MTNNIPVNINEEFMKLIQAHTQQSMVSSMLDKKAAEVNISLLFFGGRAQVTTNDDGSFSATTPDGKQHLVATQEQYDKIVVAQSIPQRHLT